MVGNPTCLLKQMGDTVGGPQTGLVAQSLRSAFESLFDLAEILCAQAWLAASTARLLQSGAAFLPQLDRPLTYRLPVHPDSPRHSRLTVPLLQQPRRMHPPLLKRLKVSSNSCRISHAQTIAWN
jgi:hypothetical protein